MTRAQMDWDKEAERLTVTLPPAHRLAPQPR